MELDNDQVMAAVGTFLILLGHVAAIVGKPKAIQAVRVLSLIWDGLAANYGKAKNKDS